MENESVPCIEKLRFHLISTHNAHRLLKFAHLVSERSFRSAGQSKSRKTGSEWLRHGVPPARFRTSCMVIRACSLIAQEYLLPM